MDEKKRKRQDEKKKKEASQKKAAEQKTKVPDSAKASPAPPPPPANPCATPSSSLPATASSSSSSCSSTSSGNGKRALSSSGQAQQPQSAQRYPPREVPPRFRQQEHKQLLKRGQPLPPGALVGPGRPQPSASAIGTSAASQPTEVSLQSGLGAQYENPLWGHLSANQSATTTANPRGWDQLIIDEKDTEEWPSISHSSANQAASLGGCPSDTEPGGLAITSSSSSSTMSMATGANGPTGHFPASHPSSKASASGPGPANHIGAGMLSGQAAANRGWGSGDGKRDSPIGGGGPRGWGSTSSSSASNFNLNLNPNANPSAWPVLGHDGADPGGGSLGGSNPPSQPPPAINLCGQPGAPPPAQCNTNNNAGAMATNGNPTGSSNWGGASPLDPSPSMNVSFSSSEPQNLNPDGPNHANKQEQASPMQSLSSWGASPSMGPNTHGAPQVNGDDVGGSVWGGSRADPASSKEPSAGWDSGSGWGHSGGGSGGTVSSAGWGAQTSGSGWGKQPLGETQGGWDAPGSPPQQQQQQQDQQAGSWSRAPSTAVPSEGSGDSQDGQPCRRDRSSRDEPPAPLLPTPDLDPRVLCNTGWGQTPVRQHTTWDMEEAARANRKKESGTDSWGSTVANDPPIRVESGTKSAERPGPGVGPGPAPQGTPGWGGNMAPTNQPNSGGWGESPGNKKPTNGPGSWGNPPPVGPGSNMPKVAVQSWGEEKTPSWDEPQSKAKAQPQGWGEPAKAAPGWGNGGGAGGGDWDNSGERKKSSPTTPAWEGESGGSWKDNTRNWGKSAPGAGPGPGAVPAGAGGGGWGDPVSQRPGGPTQGWGAKPQDGPNNNSAGGSMGSWGGTMKQGGSGWGAEGKTEASGGESTGWEEPSPPSIRRKMEIDDGTSAWGDPGSHNKGVNLWDRNNPGGQQGKPPPSNPPGPGNNNNNHPHGPQPHPPHTYNGPPPPLHNPQNPGQAGGLMDPAGPHQAGPPHSRAPVMAPGWGDGPSSHAKPEPPSSSSWGEPAPPPVSVDNGTAAWGKTAGGWRDVGSDTYSRGNPPMGSAPCKPVPKSMQDSWGGGGGGDEMGLSGGQWESDDRDMWNNAPSQDSSSSWGNGPKKGPPKGKMPVKQQEEVWIMNRLIKQLTDMGFPRDPAEEALKSSNMNLDQAMSVLLEKKTELDKRAGGGGMVGGGMADYNNGLVHKSMGCRPPLLSKDPSSDPRSPFMEKMAGGMYGAGGAPQGRPLQQTQPPPPQPLLPALSSSQANLRAQVPQFLSPQVQAQLLQFAAKNIGLNPALLTSPINPQHMALLHQLYQLQLAYQRLQIQQQMLQAQRNVSGPIRQQEQQVARTINNMQQQIQQHQRQLAQALLLKHQQQQQPLSHAAGPLHPGSAKSALESYPGHPGQAPGLPDLQTKEPQSLPNAYSPYPLSGLNHNMNVNCIEMGVVSLKEPPQPQSRLSQWTHPNSIESLSGNSSPLEPSLGKHGANLGPPGKPSLDDSYGPYLLPNAESPTSPLVAPDSWGPVPGKSPNDKMANGTNINWPPEFCPGVPWKGLQNIDPENDPNMTPGSVPSGPTINTNIQDVNRYLLRDRSGDSSPSSSQNEGLPCSADWPVSAFSSSFSLSSPEADDPGKLSDMKSTWSQGPISHSQGSLSHELWKVPQGPRSAAALARPPPGLTNPKPSTASSTWGGNSLGLAQGWSSSYSSAGTTWSTDSSTRTSSWLVLRNLTPQIDGSTLRTLCMQHGPLITFHLNLTQGNALVRYSSKEEAAKAQKSLHMCVLGNTTILAEFAGEEEVNRFFAQGQSLGVTTSWQANQSTNQTCMGGSSGPGASHPIGHHWNSGGGSVGGGAKAGGGGGGDLLWGGGQQYSSFWGPSSGEEGRVMGSPTPINTLLPGDLLSGESM